MSADGRHDRYAAAGVDYATLDGAKRKALVGALSTAGAAARLGASVLGASRGEPAVVVNLGALNLAFVLECLGTKSLIASACEQALGIDRFFDVGFDTVASVVNDICCVGAIPFVVNAYFATGASSFYEGTRHASLVDGFAAACQEVGAEWGGGESPTLSGLVADGAIDLAASAVGVVPDPISPILGASLCSGDEIVLVSSSGLHQNGASLVRALVDALPDGYATTLASGRSFGEVVLDRSIVYPPLVEALFGAAVVPHYMSHITGHGLRKLMRPDREFTYRIERLPGVPEVLEFLRTRLSMSDREAYGTFNMGAGFALYVGNGDGERACEVARGAGYEAIVAGRVEEGARSVILEPIDVVYASEELELR